MAIALLLAASTAQPPGRLVVLTVVDQLRYEDLLWVAQELGPKGFAGLGQPAQMRYETAVTETAADHATLATGTYGDVSGVIGNWFWHDGVRREAVDDPACPVWGAKIGKSARALLVPTVGDAYKLNRDGRPKVVSISVKDRSALFLGGPSADLALWWETETGEMASSACYALAAPDWVPRHPAEAYRSWTWTMSRPDAISRLVPEARMPGAVPSYEVGPEFPHAVGQGKVDARLFKAIRYTPAGTTIALQTARAAVAAYHLGETPGQADLLTVAVAAVDTVGHQFGTLARERVDAILRTHAELSAFFDELRARFGPRLSIVLTADHGVTPMMADEQRLRVPQGGTLDVDELTARLDRALEKAVGPHPDGWVAGVDANAVALKPPFPPRAVEVVAATLRAEPGIFRVVPAGEMDRADPIVRHAYFAGRSGDVLFVLRPLWTLKKRSDGADHGSPWNDDALVPLFVQAKGARLGGERVFRATQVAPTLSRLLGTAPPAAAYDVPAIE
jgi:hypothetical protein